MGMKWTEEQKEVITLRGCNILVSAAAGSGKTAVLTERILTMLTDPVHPRDIDRLLIVTFTNAAAGEMKDRIRESIEKKLMEDLTENVREHLQRQTALLSNAQITTIHSFCQYVIRNYFHTIDLDPNFRIADEGEQRLMKHDVLETLLEEKYAEASEEFLYLVECLSAGRNDSEIEKTVLQIYEYSRSFPWPEKWMEMCVENYEWDQTEEDTKWLKHVMEQVRITLQDIRERILEALDVTQEEHGPYMYQDALLKDLDLVEALMQSEDYYECSQEFEQSGAFSRLSGKKDKDVWEEKREQAKKIREEYKKQVEELKEAYFYASAEDMRSEMQDMACMVRELLHLTNTFAERYTKEKRKKNLMDFNDLEHIALKILIQEENGEAHPTAVAQAFSGLYQEIMIDEYQDSNLVQEMILTSISGVRNENYNIFMVGDVKQSIYRFRLARPELFMEKYDTYSPTEGSCRRIDLHKNFRSREEVLTAVNFVFEQIMEEHLGGIRYDEAAALYPGAVFGEAPDSENYDTEVILVDTDQKTEADGEVSSEEIEATDREMEARAIGRRIRLMVGKEQVWDKETGAYRPAEYGDIVILLRTVSGWAEVFARTLAEMGIPTHTGSRTGYFSATEVQTVLSFLQIIDNPRQDIPLTAVLHSPIVGLSGEELAAIRSRYPDRPFYESCMEEEGLKEFFEQLEIFRSRAVYLSMHELLWEIYDKTGYRNYVTAMPGGEQRKANLDMLVEKAIVYEEGSYRGLYNFIRYIENLKKYEVDFGEAEIGNEAGGMVRMMTIHKSKGLEFPVVFVSGMGKKFNQSDVRSAVVLHAELGLGADWVNPVLRVRSATLLKRIIKQQIQCENLGEELRVLYVAMTRAKEKLIFTGTVKNIEERIRKWSAVCRRKEIPLSFSQRSHVSCYWDWVMPSLMRNRCAQELLSKCLISQETDHPLWKRDICCHIFVTDMKDLILEEKERQKEAYLTKEALLGMPKELVVDEDTQEFLKKQFSYRYPYEASGRIPGKVSVSELKKTGQREMEEAQERLYEEPVPVPFVPKFMEKETESSGAYRGTVYHRFMECVDFNLFSENAFLPENGENTESSHCSAIIKQELARMQAQGQITEEEAALLSIQKLEWFFESPLSRRMVQASERGQLFRERQFVMECEANEVDKEWNSEEQVLIQGIIDACFVEEDEIVLLDYKTDFVKPQEASFLCEKYKVQLEYYRKALERLMGKKVKETYLYSFCLNRALYVQ